MLTIVAQHVTCAYMELQHSISVIKGILILYGRMLSMRSNCIALYLLSYILSNTYIKF